MSNERIQQTTKNLSEQDRYPQPDLIVPRLTVELFEYLHQEKGIKYAVVDLDNTLVDAVPNSKGEYNMDEASFDALRQARSNGFLTEYILLSNIQVPLPYLQKRVVHFAKILDTDLHYAATWPYGKPHPRPLETAFQMMGSKAVETVVIGDQLGKDVRVARNVEAFSVLRYPYFGRDPLFRKKKREREQDIIKGFLPEKNDGLWTVPLASTILNALSN